MDIIKMSNKHIDECVDLFIDVFTKAPWHDTYSSRKQHNSFVDYEQKEEASIIALRKKKKKPWINGMEYYIDQFCVKTDLQGKGIGSYFLILIENEIQTEKMNAIILNTERGFPGEKFYKKNGFQSVDELITLTK